MVAVWANAFGLMCLAYEEPERAREETKEAPVEGGWMGGGCNPLHTALRVKIRRICHGSTVTEKARLVG